MKEPEWVALEVVLAIQEAQLAEHGGSLGLRDRGLLESALVRPQNSFHYSLGPKLHELAAAYAAGITMNHPFIDGNKRTAWIVCALFLELNGRSVIAGQVEVVECVVGLAAGALTEDQFAAWLAQKNVTTRALRKKHA